MGSVEKNLKDLFLNKKKDPWTTPGEIVGGALGAVAGGVIGATIGIATAGFGIPGTVPGIVGGGTAGAVIGRKIEKFFFGK